MEDGPHRERLDAALAVEAEGQRLLLAGDEPAGRERMAAAAAAYRQSWELAPPRSFGRLVGMLKAAVIAGDAADAATYARVALDDACDSPASCYALAIAALVQGDDEAATRAAAGMRGASPAFERAADAAVALAAGDAEEFAVAAGAIVEDFSGREEHLTGVAIADTALMLERLAAERGMAARVASPLLPPG